MSRIPVLLLKTRSTPTDTYEEHFSAPDSPFTPSFVPVLEHRPNEANLQRIKSLLRDRTLNRRYGGMIFTSQRAVEGFARVVGEVEREEEGTDTGRGNVIPSTTPAAYDLTSPFPLYVVGPATARTISSVLHSPIIVPLHPQILGAETSNGETLAHYILKHYNHAHYRDYFALYEAPRLPFVPLVGNRSEQYPRLEKEDLRLRKRGLLFLVGEQRRDVIPRTLMAEDLGEGRIEVEEVEVYKTGVMESFAEDFRERIHGLEKQDHGRIVIVVFSPSGCEAMLRVMGWLDRGESGMAKRKEGKFVLATIGPTTRDHLKEKFGVEPDVTAKEPSPEGVREGVSGFLRGRGWL